MSAMSEGPRRTLPIGGGEDGRGWLRRLIALSAVPADPEDARRYLQERMAAYYGLLALLYGFTFVASRVHAAYLAPDWPEVQLDHPVPWLHLGLFVAAGVSWLVLTRKRWSAGMLDVADSVASFEQGLLLGLILTQGLPAAYRPEPEMFLAMAHILAARAAIVPSTPSRTAWVGAFAYLPLIAATYFIHAGEPASPTAPGELGLASKVYVAVMWSVVSIVATTAIGYVVYGLHRQVREAKRLGQYTLEERIGEGGMGVVYRARHALLRRPTAVKLLRPELTDRRSLARFEREVQRTAQLTHPNTIAVFDYGRTPGGVFYYAMEFLDGFDLRTLVRLDGPMPAPRVVHVLAQAAGALAEAHHVGLIHRDVKPGNLVLIRRWLTPDFVKVLDFGLVREMVADPAASDLSIQSGVIEGTPHYMSPEQVVEPGAVDPRSDLYSLGAVAYFLLTGRPPYDGKSAVAIVAEHLHGTPPPPSSLVDGVPPALEALVLRLLAKDPAERPADGAALLAELAACGAGGALGPAWTADQAQGWWEQRAPRLQATLAAEARAGGPDGVSADDAGEVPTILVDLDERHAPVTATTGG